VVVLDSNDITAEALSAVPVPLAAIVDDPPAVPLPVQLLIDGSVDAGSKRWPTTTGTTLLLGPEFVLLRASFAAPVHRSIAQNVNRVLVTTGGSDVDGSCSRLVRAARSARPQARLDVVVGPYFSEQELTALARLASHDQQVILHRHADVESLMRDTDLAVTGGGQTTYELAATGTPTVAVSLASNQMTNLEGLAKRGTLLLADAEIGLERSVAECVRTLANGVAARRAMSAAGRAVIDGRGAARVARAVLAECERG
jgi:spore coat polysaccharide biosynthesis predicted glycosyltransferase SpsG